MKNQTNQFRFRKIFYAMFPILALVLLLYSCSAENTGTSSANDFKALKQDALNSVTENFHFDVAAGVVSFTTTKGVSISFNASNLTLNENSVTGTIDLKVIEIFDGATMLATGMHTMGLMPDGKHAVMNSGGEIYINATKNGHQLEINSVIELTIPTHLTDDVGGNPDMTLWNFVEEDTTWVPKVEEIASGAGVFLNNPAGIPGEANTYYAYINHFGWTNVDCFFEDPRPRTTILASVPSGYTNQNSAIYLHYDGQGNALALLDTYDPSTKLFSEHYGQIPIGLVCHVIFVTEDNGRWRYAIKATTIAEGDIYNFTFDETTVGTEAQLIAAIDALP
ncbi:MAG: hypothetical protein ABIQ27_14455 [Flavobacterium sp.]|uniref:hypothetical protein n=1 Tax=Flavobacterium sp. TaxID=239 RepID=UPI00326554E7